MTVEEAAYYVGFGDDDVDDFWQLVALGQMPKARFKVDGRPMWDRREIDRALDALPYATPEDMERVK
jgi:hypothetical protein